MQNGFAAAWTPVAEAAAEHLSLTNILSFLVYCKARAQSSVLVICVGHCTCRACSRSSSISIGRVRVCEPWTLSTCNRQVRPWAVLCCCYNPCAGALGRARTQQHCRARAAGPELVHGFQPIDAREGLLAFPGKLRAPWLQARAGRGRRKEGVSPHAQHRRGGKATAIALARRGTGWRHGPRGTAFAGSRANLPRFQAPPTFA